MYTTLSGQLSIKIIPQDGGNAPIGKLADAEIYFHDGLLAGLKLIGFAVWRSRTAGCVTNVTFPARAYTVNGERRTFALLRPSGDAIDAQDAIRAAIIEAYDMQQGDVEPGPVDILTDPTFARAVANAGPGIAAPTVSPKDAAPCATSSVGFSF